MSCSKSRPRHRVRPSTIGSRPPFRPPLRVRVSCRPSEPLPRSNPDRPSRIASAKPILPPRPRTAAPGSRSCAEDGEGHRGLESFPRGLSFVGRSDPAESLRSSEPETWPPAGRDRRFGPPHPRPARPEGLRTPRPGRRKPQRSQRDTARPRSPCDWISPMTASVSWPSVPLHDLPTGRSVPHSPQR